MAKLTTEQRNALPESDFALPQTRDLPIHDKNHVSMAWKMVDKTKGLTDAQRKEARHRILERAKTLGVDTTDWNIKAMAFEAMSLEVPVTEDHPNKIPFSGVLTKVDELSDKPPSGADGKRVMITRAAAEAAIPSILGMAVDFKAGFDGHDPKQKIGIISEANIEGNDFRIAGFFYGADFPEEVAYIQAHQDELGFSYEVKRARIASLDEPHLTVDSLIFSGGAILKKVDAAYTSTSLSAEADAETDMTKEDFEKLLAPITKQVTDLAANVEELKKAKPTEKTLDAASVAHMVNPHSTAIRAAADGMEKAGLGLHEKRGHVAQLRSMADSMDAEAALGKLPHMYDSGSQYYAGADKDLQAAAAAKQEKAIQAVSDAVAGLSSQIKDLAAKAFEAAPAPERKTLPASVQQLVDKGHLKLDAAGDGKLTVAELDKALTAAGITGTSQRMAIKTDLAASGRLAA